MQPRFKVLSTCLLLIASCSALTNYAQAQVLTVGGHVGYNIDDEEPVVGIQLRAGITNEPLTLAINPSVETYFIEDATYLQADANLLALLGRNYVQFYQPYAGAGLALNYYYDFLGQDTALAFNLLAGITFLPGSPFQPFAQARYTIGDGEYLTVMGGVLFSLGG